jgi:hypothetical protein
MPNQNGKAMPLHPSITLHLAIEQNQVVLKTIDLHDVPNGWQTAHAMLLGALNTALAEITKEYQQDRPLVEIPAGRAQRFLQ